MAETTEEFVLELRGIDREPDGGRMEVVRLGTDAGDINCRFRDTQRGDCAVLWVFGTGGGFAGPAGGLSTRMGQALAGFGIASLEVSYRQPGDFIPCVLDTLLGVEFLKMAGRNRVILIGHSFGGAVVIAAGSLSPEVIGVAALSTQTRGADAVDQISPRPILFIHGTEDDVLPDVCSHQLYASAREPKKLILYRCGHGFDECRDEVDRDLSAWIYQVAGAISLLS